MWNLDCCIETLPKFFREKSKCSWLIFRNWYKFDNFLKINGVSTQSSSGHVECVLHNPAGRTRQSSETICSHPILIGKTCPSEWKILLRMFLWTRTKHKCQIYRIFSKFGIVLPQLLIDKKIFFLKRFYSQMCLWTRKMQFLVPCQKNLSKIWKKNCAKKELNKSFEFSWERNFLLRHGLQFCNPPNVGKNFTKLPKVFSSQTNIDEKIVSFRRNNSLQVFLMDT